MKTRLLAPLPLLSLLLVACGPTVNPADPSSLVNPLLLEPPPIYSLIGYRADLELSSEQIEALDSIAQAVQRETSPVIAELREEAATQSRRYRGLIVVTEENRPALIRVRDQNRAAVAAVEELLTPEQEAEVCRLYNRDRDRNRDRRSEREEAERRRALREAEEAAGDSLIFRLGPAWSWCAA